MPQSQSGWQRIRSRVTDTVSNGKDTLTITDKTQLVFRAGQLAALAIAIWVFATEFAGIRSHLASMQRTMDRLSGIVEGEMRQEIRELRDRIIQLERTQR